MSDLESKKSPTIVDDPRVLPAVLELTGIFTEILVLAKTRNFPPIPPIPIPPIPPIPPPSPTPIPPPPPPPVTGVGRDGVKMIYPTASTGTEFFINMDDPYKGGAYTSRPEAQFNISYGTGSQFPFTTHTDPNGLKYFNTEGSPITYASGSPPGRSVRLDVYNVGGKWADKTNFSWKSNPGYLYKPDGVGSGEFTVFIRTHGDLGTHQSYACKIGGRDEDAIRSLIEMVYPTATHNDVQVNYNYAHFPYVNVKPTIVNAPPKLVAEQWIGVKCVHKIAADKKSSDWELWFDDNPFDSNGKPVNNWRLAATYHDVGVSGYNNIPLTWKSQKDLCRVDGFKSVDFTLISNREIDFSGNVPPPSPPPTPAPIPPPPPTPNTLTVPDETLTTQQNQPLEITLVANDSIQGAAITFEIINDPPDGKIDQNSTNSGVLIYTPNQGFAGKDIFNYRAIDDKNQTSNVGTIGIVVTMPPSPPPSPPPIPPPSPVNIMGTVDVSNMSSASDADIANWVAAVKIQADRDVAPIWGHSVNFNIIPKGGVPNAGNWQCGFFDNTDQPGDLGWHDLGPNGEPLIKCFVKEAEKFGESPSVTLSHEIIESIGDANANTTVKGFDNNGKPATLFQELCDMVESNFYDINGIKVSNFVTPDWFGETPQAGFFDFLKVLNAPWKLAHGGYEQVSYDNGATFTEIDQANKKLDLHRNEHSRWTLYKKPIEQRKKSTFKTQ